jgi:hypothetical protein
LVNTDGYCFLKTQKEAVNIGQWSEAWFYKFIFYI